MGEMSAERDQLLLSSSYIPKAEWKDYIEAIAKGLVASQVVQW